MKACSWGARSGAAILWAITTRPRSVALSAVAISALLAPSARAGTLVNFNFTNFGNVQIDLFDDLVPTTVNNFVQNYVTIGSYDNSMVHRLVPGHVIQGGGFQANTAPIATQSAIPLEYARANTRGTIAMARTDDGTLASTSTATSQWFINTADNSTALGPAPAIGDTPESFGYAVFGWVVGPGMTAVDAIAALNEFDFFPNDSSSPFKQVPVQNYTQSDFNNFVDPSSHFVILNSATVVKTHPSYQNPFLATDVNNSGTISASDAAVVINDLLLHGSHTPTAPFAGTNYLDTNGNGRVTAADALVVINALLHPGLSLQGTPFALADAAPMVVVPEPSSLALGGMALLALGARLALRRLKGPRFRLVARQ
jgi:cyclophilin family peptidyl-prolyl cis-trans isomerase